VEPLRLFFVTQTIVLNRGTHKELKDVEFQSRMNDIISIGSEFQSKPDSIIILSGPKGLVCF
jgi:hypothetical protein